MLARRYYSGLSLIEAIITLILVAVIGAVMVPMIQQGLTSFAQLYTSTQSILEGQTALNKIVYDINSITLNNLRSISQASGGTLGNPRPDAFLFNNSNNNFIYNNNANAVLPTSIPNGAMTNVATNKCCVSDPSQDGTLILYQRDRTTPSYITRTLFTYDKSNTCNTATFNLPTGNSVLVSSGGTAQILATNVSNLAFTYYNGTGATVPIALIAATVPTIRYITITLTSNNHTFTQTVFLRKSV